MTEITWTGADSTDFHDAGNWDTFETPGLLDDVSINNNVANAPVISGVASIGSLQIGADLGVTGQLIVTGLTSIGGSSATLEFGEGSLSNLAQLEISQFAVVTNFGSLTVGGLAQSTGDGLGKLENFGALQVGGDMGGQVFNSGSVTISAASTIKGYETTSNDAELRVEGELEVESPRSTFAGSVEFKLSSDPQANVGIFASGGLAVGLTSLSVDTASAGALIEGNERTLFNSGSTAFETFSVTNYTVTGQHASFAYALRVTGVGEFASEVSLVALNDGATGGRAVLADSATSRDITLAINSDTGRGTIFGGSFADLHASLLHGVDEVRAGSGDDVLVVNGGAAGFTFVGNLGADSMTGGTGADALSGGGGADTIRGGGGADTLRGGAENDLFFASSIDTIIEAASGGTDTVRSAGAFVLGVNLEHLILTGAGTNNGTGNALDNRLTGNDSANRLDGNSGADKLKGNAGDDTLTGGTGADDFVFVSGSGLDRITDFNATGSNADDIDLRGHIQILSFADLMNNHVTVSGSNIVITAGADVITLVKVRLADLDASDFIF